MAGTDSETVTSWMNLHRLCRGGSCPRPWWGVHDFETGRHEGVLYSCVSIGNSVLFLISVTAMCECSSPMKGLLKRVLRAKDS